MGLLFKKKKIRELNSSIMRSKTNNNNNNNKNPKE